jgi:REP element-mobilizing transposase RayT
MKSNIPPLQPETFYHIYNRGINGEDIFKQSENYFYFIKKYSDLISPVADTYAYCLLKNHFHILIKTKSQGEILALCKQEKNLSSQAAISLKFSHLFNGYAQGINKQYHRTGSLFETPFRRIAVNEEEYLRRLIFYIHYNPEKHRLCKDFRAYQFSSYLAILSELKTKVMKQEVLTWFGGKQGFLTFHSDLKNMHIETTHFE